MFHQPMVSGTTLTGYLDETECRMPESAEKIQILVVDDSPVYRKLVEHAVCEDTYSLLFAKSGQEALDLFALHAPPIVITDWLMPDFSGLELCQRIREGASKRYTYLIV